MASSFLFQRAFKHAFARPPRPFAAGMQSTLRITRLHTCAPPSLALRSPSLAPPSLKAGSILHFLRSRILQATHRDSRQRIPFGRSSLSSRSQRPAWQKQLEPFKRLPSGVILWGIAGLNVAVFASWYIARAVYESDRNPKPLMFMLNNFCTSWNNVTSGRVWTLLTSSFSHNSFDHILFNGLSYYFMAPTVMAMLGNVPFLSLYLAGGLGCSVFSMLWNDRNTMSQGASGAIYSILSFFACVHPRATFLIFGIVPCPAWVWVGGIFAYDAYRSLANKRGNTDTAGHIGGLATGVAYYLLKWRLRLF